MSENSKFKFVNHDTYVHTHTLCAMSCFIRRLITIVDNRNETEIVEEWTFFLFFCDYSATLHIYYGGSCAGFVVLLRFFVFFLLFSQLVKFVKSNWADFAGVPYRIYARRMPRDQYVPPPSYNGHLLWFFFPSISTATLSRENTAWRCIKRNWRVSFTSVRFITYA